ncbi:glycosyltransferase family 9 protein [Gammaproteobacteria bacterium]|jgi:heptosyltransferase I|nr:glycosyltransferase family 9 protein [Gammaproteobacteria bacterium]MBT7815023.1 glycosyltransferase family 9 protein [Gammaproteobacteria bacterium]MDA9896468.1 glycosyltransferase family 9 protein [Gammaproteobacteria bacterium]
MQNNKQKVENICVLRTSSIGDICHMLPFIFTIRKEYPNAKISWVIGKNEADFIGNINGIQYIVFDRNNTLKSYFSIYKKLKKIKFDVMFIMQVSLRANIISLLIESKIKIGYDLNRSSDLHSIFSNKKIQSSKHSHVVDVFLSFLNVLSIEKSNFIYKWDIEERITKKQLFKKFFELQDKYFVLSPCSRSANRNWLVDRYAAVADYININFGIQCVLSSSSNSFEEEFVKDIISSMKSKPLNLSGRTNLHELYSLVKNSELLISPDSGPIHIATCAGKPAIGLYGVTNTVRAGPYNSRDLCIDKYNEALLKYKGLESHQAKWRYKNNNKNVMSLISTEEVIEKIDKYFKERSVS